MLAVEDTAEVELHRGARLAEVAELAQLLASDEPLRAAVLAGQERRLAAFAPESVLGTLRGHLESL
jgi:hypothetical protein